MSEIQADLRLHLDLIDTAELIFNGILDGNDLEGRRVKLGQ